MPELRDVRVLITGDDEADLGVVGSGLPGAVEVAQGLSAAVAAMRLREFGALVADVQSVQDALALLRAARRSRPVTRGIVLIPADQDPGAGGWELVQQAAFTIVRHPVDAGVLAAVIEAARRDYGAERNGAVRAIRPESEQDAELLRDTEAMRWHLAERRLAAVLRRTVSGWATRSQYGVDDAVQRGVEAVAMATKNAQGSPEMLLAIAIALGEGEAAKSGEAA